MSAPELPTAGARALSVALVNNMPDAAFVDTERQFRAATSQVGETPVELRLYTMAGLPRSGEIVAVIRSRYQALEALWDRPPDAMIVTGTEPVQARLQYEPYWPYLARLLEWAAESVPTTLLSCLAAHASVLLLDGIERVPRAVKCSGVFAGAADSGDPLGAGLPELVPVPHSRVNDVPQDALAEAGYRIVVGSGPADPGWAIAARQQQNSLFVLCQGHPEYSPESLLREYRRDVRRNLLGRGAFPYPAVPAGYLDDRATALVERFRAQAGARGVDPRELWERFPYEDALAGVTNTWAAPSATFYSNWLATAKAGLPA